MLFLSLTTAVKRACCDVWSSGIRQMEFWEVLSCGKSVQNVVMKDTASEDSLVSIIQVAAIEMYLISYVNRVNHKW